jgi:hypothetical protein
MDWEEGEVVLRFRPRRARLLPEDARSHLRASGRELLLALRSMIDEALEREAKSGGQHRRTRIPVKEEGETE